QLTKFHQLNMVIRNVDTTYQNKVSKVQIFYRGKKFAAIIVKTKTQKMNLNNFTIKAQEIVHAAQQLAFERQSPSIETAHVMEALLNDDDGPIEYLLKKNNVAVSTVKTKDEQLLEKIAKMPDGDPAQTISRDLNTMF